jgi:hypothetical protein
MTREESRIIDYRDYPEINCTSMADCYTLDTRVRFVMWDWIKIDGVWQRRVSGTLTRPIAGLVEDTARAMDLMLTAKPPQEEVRARMTH